MTDHEQRSEFASDRADLEAAEDVAREARLEQAKKEEVLAWCYQRQAEREAAERNASKPQPEPDRTSRRREVSQHQGAEMTRDWQDYIRRELEAQQRATMKAVAQVVIDEERAREALQRRVEQLETEIAELRQERGGSRLRAVPAAAPSTLIA
jgi:hypothetical protein